ncbi:hypothetical protein ElyMa_002841000, partial [Elysia marginata]
LVIGRLDVSTEEKDLLLELNLLPLFVLTSATPQLVMKFSPEVIAKVKCAVVSSSSAHPVPVMKQAVENLYSILSNQIALVSGDHVELLKYFSLQTLTAPPTVLRPLVCGGQLRNNEVVNFLHDSFPHLRDFKDKSSGHVENILTIMQCVMKQPGLTHVNIQVAMDCYVKLTKDARNIDPALVVPPHPLHLLNSPLGALARPVGPGRQACAAQCVDSCMEISIAHPSASTFHFVLRPIWGLSISFHLVMRC